jgi:serine/threonine protein kinase
MTTQTLKPETAVHGLLEVAQSMGLLDDAQVSSVRALQLRTNQIGMKLPLGQTLLERKYLTPVQLKEVRQELVRRVTGEKAAALSRPQAGQPLKIGQYEIVELLSDKERSRVYIARDTAMNRLVVLKLLPAGVMGDRQWLERFRREVEVSGRLVHPNIATAYGAGTIDSRPYLVMEYVDGMPLSERLEREGNLPEATAWTITREVVKALAFAESMGVLHRDIKPENIVFTADGKVKIIDMGFSKLSGQDNDLTQQGTTVGTPFYIAPEQARGDPKLDIRADLYSLGCTVYHMLTGSVPFYHEDFLEVMRLQIQAPRPDPRSVLPEICEGSAQLVMQMMSLSPDKRLRPDDLLAQIDALLAELPEHVEAVRPTLQIEASVTAVSVAIKGDPELAPARPLDGKPGAPPLATAMINCAIELKLLTAAQAEAARTQRSRMEQAGIILPVGAMLLGKSFLTLQQLEKLCALLRKRGYARKSEAAPADLRFDVYDVKRKLSSKERSIVYLAHNRIMKRDVALRVLPKAVADDPVRLARFEREVQLLAKLVHPNIATALESGTHKGCPFMATEFLEGLTLAERLEREGRFSERVAWKLALEIARGLAFAAKHGIVHRDIKPDNIICGFDGQVKIIDFGLSKGNDDNSLTLQGTTVGTPYFIAPEQARGSGLLDVRSDIYSLGCTVYQMLTGALPFYHDEFFEVMRDHTEAMRPEPRVMAPELSADSANLVKRMMSIPIEPRPSADELIQQIEGLLSILPHERLHIPAAPPPAKPLPQPAPAKPRVDPISSTVVGITIQTPPYQPTPKVSALKTPSAPKSKTRWQRITGWMSGR